MLYENHDAGNASENRLGHDVVSDSAISCRPYKPVAAGLPKGALKAGVDHVYLSDEV